VRGLALVLFYDRRAKGDVNLIWLKFQKLCAMKSCTGRCFILHCTTVS
jgi:hypothetical protein